MEWRIARALSVLRGAQDKAAEIAAKPQADPKWGPWHRRADQRNVYESAIERAIEVLEGRDDHT